MSWILFSLKKERKKKPVNQSRRKKRLFSPAEKSPFSILIFHSMYYCISVRFYIVCVYMLQVERKLIVNSTSMTGRPSLPQWKIMGKSIATWKTHLLILLFIPARYRISMCFYYWRIRFVRHKTELIINSLSMTIQLAHLRLLSPFSPGGLRACIHSVYLYFSDRLKFPLVSLTAYYREAHSTSKTFERLPLKLGSLSAPCDFFFFLREMQ